MPNPTHTRLQQEQETTQKIWKIYNRFVSRFIAKRYKNASVEIILS